MSYRLSGTWSTSKDSVGGFSYICGYCGSKAGPSTAYNCNKPNGNSYVHSGTIYLCPTCNKPTFFNKEEKNEQFPGPLVGEEIEHLPLDIYQLYNEARNCIAVNAFTSSVLSCRKLLMNVSVSKGAEEGKSFVHYINFLEDNHFLPPDSREWVDHIRNKGNEATHEIQSMSRDDAVELLEFTAMLLRFVFEMPGKMAKYKVQV